MTTSPPVHCWGEGGGDGWSKLLSDNVTVLPDWNSAALLFIRSLCCCVLRIRLQKSKKSLWLLMRFFYGRTDSLNTLLSYFLWCHFLKLGFTNFCWRWKCNWYFCIICNLLQFYFFLSDSYTSYFIKWCC